MQTAVDEAEWAITEFGIDLTSMYQVFRPSRGRMNVGKGSH